MARRKESSRLELEARRERQILEKEQARKMKEITKKNKHEERRSKLPDNIPIAFELSDKEESEDSKDSSDSSDSDDSKGILYRVYFFPITVFSAETVIDRKNTPCTNIYITTTSTKICNKITIFTHVWFKLF